MEKGVNITHNVSINYNFHLYGIVFK
jgi:hypothetical protein